MVYSVLKFVKPQNRPFFYTSFVSTVDGKVWVDKEGLPAGRQGYWPIGSKTDYETFTFLRAHADVIIDGKNTALRFGKNTIETIHSKKFQNLRKKLGKKNAIQYFIVTSHPDKTLVNTLKNPYGFQPVIFTKGLKELVLYLKKQRSQRVFVDGGPKLIASMLLEDLIDEIFLTIAPKVVGNDGSAVTMVEGKLFSPKEIKNLKLVSVQQVKNELFLRYRTI